MESYAYPVFGHVRVDEVDRQDVLRVLTPIWTATPSIARKLRQRIRAIFRRAMAFGYLDINPAGEVIEGGLEPIPAVKAHFRALPYQDVADALAVVDASTAGLSAKLCFRWLVLTAARSGEARGATWSEIDMDAATWAVPASRMKAGREHRVPLSEQALDVLQEVRSLDDSSGLIFPSPMKLGRELSDMTLTKVLRCTGLAERATVHGFRTSFKPGFPILGVFRLKGQPKRDGSIKVRSCKASQSPVYPIRDAILAVNHASCPSLSSSAPRQCGETALKTSRLPGALSLLAKSWLYPPSAWRRR